MDKIAIIILNYNGLGDTLDCLESLNSLNRQGIDVGTFVVDYSDDKSEAQKIKKAFPLVTVIEKEHNLGFAQGNNVGIKRALQEGFDYILLLNNDTLVDRDFLINLYKFLVEHKEVGAVSPKIYFAKGHEFHKNRYKDDELGRVIWYVGGEIDWKNMYGSHPHVDEVDRGQFEKSQEVEYVSGCCTLIRAETLNKVDLLNEDLFLYWEDTEWSLRAKSIGWRLMMYPQAIIWHKNAGSSSSGSALQDYFLTRNRLWMGMKYAPLRTKLALIRQSLLQYIKGRVWEKRGIGDYWLGKMDQGSWRN